MPVAEPAKAAETTAWSTRWASWCVCMAIATRVQNRERMGVEIQGKCGEPGLVPVAEHCSGSMVRELRTTCSEPGIGTVVDDGP